MDWKDWDQLIDVVEDFATKIPVSRLMKAQELQEMERWLDD